MTLPPQVFNGPKSVYAVVLAAGTASRFGTTKQVADIDGEPMVRRVVRVANDVCDVQTVVVVGHDGRSVIAACEPMQGFVVNNPRYKEGLGSSITCGVHAVRNDADAVIIMLADQPLITAKHVRDLIDAWDGSDTAIVATSFADTQGPPALFGSACFDDLCALRADAGAKSLFDDQKFELTVILFEPAAVDVDTPDDLDR